MALQMGEVEVKIKANIDDAKSTLQELEGADVEINATVTVDDSELSEILDGAHEVKITAVNDTGEGVEEANSSLETVEDKQSDITAEDSTAEGVDAANASLENVEDTSADITAEDSTAEGVDAANASLETIDDTSAAITAIDNTAEAVDSATTALSDIEDEDVDITATDNTGDVIDGIESNLDAIEDESLAITAEDETGDTISTIETNLSSIEDEGIVITAEDNTGATIADIEATLAAIQDEEVTITAEADTSTAESDIAEVENADYSATVEADADTESAEEELGSLEGEATVTAEADTADAEVDLNSLEGTAKIKADTTALTESIQSILSKGWEITVKVADIIGDIVSFGAKLGKSIWDGVLSNATEYDDNATAAAIMGVTYQEYMSMKWMADQIDTDPETIMTAARTVKSDLESMFVEDKAGLVGSAYEAVMKSNAEKINKWRSSIQFEALGGTLGQGYDNASEAFQTLGTKGIMDAYVRYIASQSESKQEQLTLQLFGSRGAYLTPWINAARNGTYDEYVKKYGDATSIYGAAVDDETTGKLGALADAKADFLSCIDALTTFATSLAAPGMTAIFETLTSTIEEIYKIFDSDATDEEKGQQIAETIKTNLGNLWNQLQEWANSLATILSPVLDVIGAFFDSIINKIKQKIGYNDITRYDIFEAGKNEEVLPGFAEISKQYTKTGKYSYTDAQKNLWADNLSKLAFDTYGYELNSEGRQTLIDIMSTTAPNLLVGALEKFDWENYLDYYGLDKKKPTDGTTDGTTTETKDGDVPLTGWADLQQSLNTAYDSFTASNDSVTSALSDLQLGVTVKEGDTTVNCYGGTTADVSKGTTQVEKYNQSKADGKSFSNGAGRGK